MDVREKLVGIVCDPAQINGCIHRCNHPPCAIVSDIVDALIANGVTVQEWISVKDRLPEESGNYIVCCDDSSCSYGEGIWYSSDVVVVSEYYEGSWTWYEGGTEWSLENIVTHWMPLPQPPKGE